MPAAILAFNPNTPQRPNRPSHTRVGRFLDGKSKRDAALVAHVAGTRAGTRQRPRNPNPPPDIEVIASRAAALLSRELMSFSTIAQLLMFEQAQYLPVRSSEKMIAECALSFRPNSRHVMPNAVRNLLLSIAESRPSGLRPHNDAPRQMVLLTEQLHLPTRLEPLRAVPPTFPHCESHGPRVGSCAR